MSQINANFQELISNSSNNNNQSNALDNVAGTAIITSETLQGFSMANQFAICANSGNGPVLLSCLTPMILPTLASTSKSNFELTSADNRSQNQPQTVQIQLASPFNFAGNLCNANNAQSLPSLGLSYINLSSLTNAGTSFPLQITLNNSNNNGTHQLTIPTATLNSLNQEVQSVQLAQNYQINSQVKFESELSVSSGQQQQQQQQRHQVQMQQQQQHTIVNHAIQDISDNDDKTKRKPRRRIPNKSIKTVTSNGNADNNNQSTNNAGSAPVTEERLLDHKGRPFIYNCPNCPKKFTLNSRLTAHLRCHTGIRPYTCIQCGFSFTQKSYLIRHAAVHTEERPFTCERCLKTYKHYGSLANHRKLHRKEDKNGGGGLGGGTSEISDSDQKQTSNEVTATTVTMVDESNFENILQLHSDWSTLDNGATSTSTTTYIITNSSNNNNSVLAGTGPVAFPDQPQRGLESAVAKSSQSSAVFMDLHLIPSSSSSSSNHHQSHLHTDSSLYADPHALSQPSTHVVVAAASSASACSASYSAST